MNVLSAAGRAAGLALAALALAGCAPSVTSLEPFDGLKDYDFVFALPQDIDPTYEWLSNFAHTKAPSIFKSVTHERAFEGYRAGGRYAIVADASGSLVGAELRDLGARLADDGPRLGSRYYDADDALFVARYGRDGAEILLESAYRVSVLINRDFEMPAAWGYVLYSRDGAVIERGDIRPRLRGYALRPTVMNAAAATPSATGRKAREAAYDAAVAACVSYPADGDYDYIDALAAPADGSEVRMIFIGEEHYQQKIYDEEIALAWRLREKHGYGVFAKEGLFSEGPFAEAAGSGTRLPSVLPDRFVGADEEGFADPVLAAINGRNRTLEPEARVLCTSIDIDHAINHTKSATMRYWGYLATRCPSAVGRAELAAHIPSLSSTASLESVEAWLDGLEALFRRHGNGMTTEDEAEIGLALRIDRASARYQLDERHDEEGAADQDFEEVRCEYFRESIERALRLATNRGGRLACCVGGAHAILSDFGEGDYPVGRISEARYFNEECEATAGAVRSIVIRLAGMTADNELIARIVRLSEGRRRVYIDLHALGAVLGEEAGRNELFTPEGRPKVDALLLLL